MWMRAGAIVIVGVFLAPLPIPLGAQQRPAASADISGARDHPLVGRYEGSALRLFQEKQYEEQRIINRPVLAADIRAENNQRRNARNSIQVAGRSWRMRYEGPTGRSALEVTRNFQQKLEGQRFEVLFTCRGRECGGTGADLWFAVAESPMNPGGGHGLPSNWDTGVYLAAKLTQPEGDVFVTIYTVERGSGAQVVPLTLVDVVETRAMERDRIVFVDAPAMQRAIAETGRVALYGILFDFDRADIRAESRPTLEEIAKYLRANPGINLVVAGHTDSQGAFDYNVALSQRRAAAVVQTLAREHGIAAARLTPFGAGMASPVASNETEEGRQRNRRVELVRR